MEKFGSRSGSGIRDEHCGSYFLELRNNFLGLEFGIFLTPDLGSGMEKFGSRIQNKHPGSATRAPVVLRGISTTIHSFYVSVMKSKTSLSLKEDYSVHGRYCTCRYLHHEVQSAFFMSSGNFNFFGLPLQISKYLGGLQYLW
jgi:hypothetical protein